MDGEDGDHPNCIDIYKTRYHDLHLDLSEIDDPSAATAEIDRSYRSISNEPQAIVASAVRSVVDERDIVYEDLPDVKERLCRPSTLPQTFTLQNQLPPIRNQGATPLAIPFAVATLVEYHTGTTNHLSPRFIYQNRPRNDFRMELREALKMAKSTGVCREVLCSTDACLISIDEERRGVVTSDSVTVDGSTLPRGSSRSRHVNTRANMDASNFRIPGYAKITTIRGAKDAIYHRGPLAVSMPCWALRPRFWLKEYGEDFKGGHCVNFVGWTPEGFIVRNSWGMRWGLDGYDIFPYVDWDEPKCYGWWEIWCVCDTVGVERPISSTVTEKAYPETKPSTRQRGCLGGCHLV
jgi:hypothetical protein